jgi:hypothetical protein
MNAIANFMSVEPLKVERKFYLLLDKADGKYNYDCRKVHDKDVCEGVVLLAGNVAELD